MTKLITKVISYFTGTKVGQDEFGNVYYRGKRIENTPRQQKEKRWVIFKGEVEASAIPPLWHAWLHGSSDQLPDSGIHTRLFPWQKPHLPNLTGTIYAYRPKGHTLRGGKRTKATGDYQAWKP